MNKWPFVRSLPTEIKLHCTDPDLKIFLGTPPHQVSLERLRDRFRVTLFARRIQTADGKTPVGM